jgi:hypothetical protein
MRRKNYFVNVGVLFLFFAGFYAYGVNQEYGSLFPKNATEWLAEIFVWFLVITAATFIAVGKYLGDDK